MKRARSAFYAGLLFSLLLSFAFAASAADQPPPDMPSNASRKLVAQIDAERTKLENTGKFAAAKIGLQVRASVLKAWESGTFRRSDDLPATVRKTLAPLDKQLPTLLRDGMVAAHLTGRLRSARIAAPQFRANGMKLASAYDDALTFLRKRLLLDEQDLAELAQTYETEALRVSSTLGTQLETRLQETVAESLQQGLGARDGVKALRGAFEAEGFVPAAGHTLETAFRTQTQLAYGAGRWNSLQDEAVQEILWGFEFVTVGDDRVRAAHAAMDGVKRPKDDPIWKEWWAPVGWNCRCTNLEIFDEGNATPDLPDARADEGFRFNPGEVFTDVIRRAA